MNAGGQLPSSNQAKSEPISDETLLPSTGAPVGAGRPEEAESPAATELSSPQYSPATLRPERIRQATLAGGLQDIPIGFDDENGDWRTILSENPFEVLYLDHELPDHLTPAIVARNHAVLVAFWRRKLQLMQQGANRGFFLHRYGQDLPKYPQRLDRAYEQIRTSEGIRQVLARLDRARRERGEQEIRGFLEGILVDEVLDFGDRELLYAKGIQAALKREEVDALLERTLHEQGFERYNDLPDGTWMTRKRYRLHLEQTRLPPVAAPPSESTHDGTMRGRKAVLVVLGLGLFVAFFFGVIRFLSSSQSRPFAPVSTISPAFTVEVTAANAPLRGEPDQEATILVTLDEGVQLGVLYARGGWYRVVQESTAGRQEGWISNHDVARIDQRSVPARVMPPDQIVAAPAPVVEQESSRTAVPAESPLARRQAEVFPAARSTSDERSKPVATRSVVPPTHAGKVVLSRYKVEPGEGTPLVRPPEGGLTVYVLSGHAAVERTEETTRTHVQVQVRCTSQQGVGVAISWSDVVAASYMIDNEGTIYRVSVSESQHGDPPAEEGDAMSGSLAFHAEGAPINLRQLTLYFAYVSPSIDAPIRIYLDVHS